MALPRFKKLEPERQELLLEIAQQEFIEHGYEQASINRIIAQAGISKGAMYYYFEGKEDLFITLINHHVERNWEAIGPLALDSLTPATYWSELEQLMERFVSFFFKDNPHLKMWRICQQLITEPATSAVHERLAHKQRFLSDLIARGQCLGVVRKDLELELLVKLMDATAITHERWISAHDQELPSVEILKVRLKVRLDLMQRICLPTEQLIHLIPNKTTARPLAHPKE